MHTHWWSRARRRHAASLSAAALLLALGLPSMATASPEVAQQATDAATPPSAPETDPQSAAASNEQFNAPDGRGGSNQVVVHNGTDGRFLMRGRVDLQHIPGPNASPVNFAEAVGACVDCQTLAVALQIDLISKDASTIAPENAAVALNEHCTRCFTSARASQYVIQVDDPRQVPDRARDLVQRMNRELDDIQHAPRMTVADAQARIDAVIGQFNDLAGSLREDRRDTEDVDSPDAPNFNVETP